MKTDPRDILKKVVYKNLIGPANATFLDRGEQEIVGTYPLSRYFSGIIFPNFEKSNQEEPDKSQLEIDFNEEDTFDNLALPDWDTETEKPESPINTNESENDDFTRSELYPYSFGLSFCINDDALNVSVILSFGLYRQIDPVLELNPNYLIPLKESDYDLIKALNSKDEQYLGNVLGYNHDNGSVFLKRKLTGNSTGKISGDFANLRDIKRVVYERLNNASGSEKDRYTKINTILRKISPLYRNGWAREQHSYQFDISLAKLDNERTIVFRSEKTKQDKFGFNIHVTMIGKERNNRIIKVLCENCSKYSMKQFFNNKPALNVLCMFQSKLYINSEHLIPLPRPLSPFHSTMEDKIIDCQYRNADVYCIAHNCASSWLVTKDRVIRIQTDFLPSVIPPVTTNNRDSMPERALSVKNNSLYSTVNDDDLIISLTAFADCYDTWIRGQLKKSASLETRYSEASKRIVEGQKTALTRMHEGINILKNNPSIMKLYRLASSAMLINMAKSQNVDINDGFGTHDNFHYHAFQLAFLLINIECIIDPKSKYRNSSIDLLWFPTGGGKTEAYFLLSAFSLVYRRYKNGAKGKGTSVIMRYTLRLLTAQQFERASRMVLALNFACYQFMPELISGGSYTIGLWIGNASSPNKLHDSEDSANEINSKIIEARDREEALRVNKFPLTDCPWCGRSLIEMGQTGFNCLKDRFEIRCLNHDCHFHKGLPIDLVDESLYRYPPSLLFATVDKFARLAWVDEATAFFGSDEGCLPPDLIIQDELHLISGPLGSITALFEGVVEMLCSRGGKTPRIIASTATIKNASAQVKGLFGNRDVFTFPPPGLDYSDNFFSKVNTDCLNREYVGIYPTGKTFTTTQLKLLALLLYGRMELIGQTDEKLDDYWTVISYYNSLRELGRMFSKVRDELSQAYSQLVLTRYPERKKCWLSRPKELTSRISGYEVKNVLHSLEATNIDDDNIQGSSNTSTDIVFATNMISVGLDIQRLNLIVMNGQPKSISEYIQVTSRIARNHPGLVFTLFNPFKVRDKSHFENFSSFHNNYYKFVEPISVTPYTRVALRKLLPTLMAAYLRLVKGIDKPNDIRESDLHDFIVFMDKRMQDEEMANFLKVKLKEHMLFLMEKLSLNPELTFKDLLHSASDASAMDYEEGDWLTVNSMRDISPNAVIKLLNPRTKKRSKDYE